MGTKLVRLPTRTLLSQAETRASDAPVSWSHGSSFKAPTSQREASYLTNLWTGSTH